MPAEKGIFLDVLPRFDMAALGVILSKIEGMFRKSGAAIGSTFGKEAEARILALAEAQRKASNISEDAEIRQERAIHATEIALQRKSLAISRATEAMSRDVAIQASSTASDDAKTASTNRVTAATIAMTNANYAYVDSQLAATARSRDAAAAAMLSAKAAQAHNEALAASAVTATNAGRAFNTMGMVATGGFLLAAAESTKMASHMEVSQTRIKVATEETAKDMKILHDGVLQLGTQVGYTAQELSDAAFILAKGGFKDGNDQLKILKAGAELARIEGAELDHTMNGLTTTLTDFSVKAEDAPKAVAQLRVAVGEAKVPLDQFMGSLHNVEPVFKMLTGGDPSKAAAGIAQVTTALAMMTKNGTNADQASQNIRNSILQLAKLGENPKAQEAAGQLGLNASVLAQQLTDPAIGYLGVLDQIHTAINDKIGPDGMILESALRMNPQAAKDLVTEYEKLDDVHKKMANDIENGTIPSLKAEHLMTAETEQGARLKNWDDARKKLEGFNPILKKNGDLLRTVLQMWADITGSTQGLLVGSQLFGNDKSAEETRALYQRNVKAKPDKNGDITDWASVTDTLKFKTDAAKASFFAMTVQVGEMLLPYMKKLADVLGTVFGWLNKHSEVAKTLVVGLGGLATAWVGVKTAMMLGGVWNALSAGAASAVKSLGLVQAAALEASAATTGIGAASTRAAAVVATASTAETTAIKAVGTAAVVTTEEVAAIGPAAATAATVAGTGSAVGSAAGAGAGAAAGGLLAKGGAAGFLARLLPMLPLFGLSAVAGVKSAEELGLPTAEFGPDGKITRWRPAPESLNLDKYDDPDMHSGNGPHRSSPLSVTGRNAHQGMVDFQPDPNIPDGTESNPIHIDLSGLNGSIDQLGSTFKSATDNIGYTFDPFKNALSKGFGLPGLAQLMTAFLANLALGNPYGKMHPELASSPGGAAAVGGNDLNLADTAEDISKMTPEELKQRSFTIKLRKAVRAYQNALRDHAAALRKGDAGKVLDTEDSVLSAREGIDQVLITQAQKSQAAIDKFNNDKRLGVDITDPNQFAKDKAAADAATGQLAKDQQTVNAIMGGAGKVDISSPSVTVTTPGGATPGATDTYPGWPTPGTHGFSASEPTTPVKGGSGQGFPLGGYFRDPNAAGAGGSYGLPSGTNSGGYGGKGAQFPAWVNEIASTFGIKPSTYAGHQESDRHESGYAANPNHENRGIDWTGPVENLQKFSDYLKTIPQSMEQVIWENPNTHQKTGIGGGVVNTGYYDQATYDEHGGNDPKNIHVHTRQSAPIPMPTSGPNIVKGSPGQGFPLRWNLGGLAQDTGAGSSSPTPVDPTGGLLSGTLSGASGPMLAGVPTGQPANALPPGVPSISGTPGAGGIFAGPYGNNGPRNATPPSIAGVPLPGVGTASVPGGASPVVPANASAPATAALPSDPVGIQSQQPTTGSGPGASVGGGLIGLAETGAALAANALAPGAGEAVSMGTQLANRLAGYASQIGGIATEGVLETFTLHDAQGSGKGGWLSKIAGGLAGVHKSAPITAGAAQGADPAQDTAQAASDSAKPLKPGDAPPPPDQQPGGSGPLVNIENMTNTAADGQQVATDIARQTMPFMLPAG